MPLNHKCPRILSQKYGHLIVSSAANKGQHQLNDQILCKLIESWFTCVVCEPPCAPCELCDMHTCAYTSLQRPM